MQVKLVKFSDNISISKNTSKDVGYDIIAEKDIFLYPEQSIVLEIPAVIEFDSEDLFYMVMPRSSFAKKGLSLANTVGIIDRSYQGKNDKLKVVLERRRPYTQVLSQEVFDDEEDALDHGFDPYPHMLVRVNGEPKILLQTIRKEVFDPLIIKKGESIAQLVFIKEALIEMIEVNAEEHEFKTPSRGGFGTTNK